MRGGPKYEYLWQDNVNYKKATKLSAPKYIAQMGTWIGAFIQVMQASVIS